MRHLTLATALLVILTGCDRDSGRNADAEKPQRVPSAKVETPATATSQPRVTQLIPNVLMADRGKPISDYATSKAGYSTMASSSQFWPAYDFLFNDCKFVLGVDDSGDIRYIQTTDPLFSSPEGLRVGDSYEKVKGVADADMLTERGWAFYVPLKSGWNAAFFQGPSMTEGELQLSTRVTWFFRR